MPFLRRPRKHATTQPRLVGIRRIPASIVAHPEIRDAIENDCRQYNVSPGFVLMTIAAKHYRIDEQPDFRTWKPKKKGGKK